MSGLLTLTTLLSAQCSLDPAASYTVNQNVIGGRRFDFIVVGAGAAGSVVARRLAENKLWTVALLESGGLPNKDSEVGGYFINLLGTDIDWDYTTEPNQTYCKGFKEGRCRWPNGKVLGGSTTTNCMVYTHAIKQDFDDWAAMGHTEWGWSGVEGYLTKSQHALNPPAGSTKQGMTGPLKTSIIDSEQTVISKLLVDAGAATGASFNDDEVTLGMYKAQNTIAGGERQSAAKAFLQDIPGNLFVFPNAHVTRVLIENRTAVGVEVLQNGIIANLWSKKEVVLSAGAIRTPQILMLSGIGPRDHLKKMNIQLIKDLPVGNNLQDHFMDMGTFVAVDTPEKPIDPAIDAFNYCEFRNGSMSTSNVLNIFWFLSTKNESRPDLQIHHLYYQKNDSFALRNFIEKAGMNEKSIDSILKANQEHEIIHYLLTQATPKSTGAIRLKTTNPLDHPLIIPGYFSDKNGEDMKALLAGAKVIEAAIKSPKMQAQNAKMVDTAIPECQGLVGDKYWECHFRHLGATAYHYCGTAAMGTVVDQRLRVNGISRLRIADASILPKITDRNLMSVTYMIAEKAADQIKEQYMI